MKTLKMRIFPAVLAVTLIFFCFGTAAFAAEPQTKALPTSSAVLVNGRTVTFDAYNIAGNNFFKLRDLAHTLNGTAKQFEVGYNETTKAIALTSGKPYTPAGGEMAGKGAGEKAAAPTQSGVTLDGTAV
ncbi:MAG: hypothetical protein LBK23_00440, partial [Oscillospiraceae bacterium]|nr:hypothetical protein [Oscillospiraceae bacterium]